MKELLDKDDPTKRADDIDDADEPEEEDEKTAFTTEATNVKDKVQELLTSNTTLMNRVESYMDRPP